MFALVKVLYEHLQTSRILHCNRSFRHPLRLLDFRTRYLDYQMSKPLVRLTFRIRNTLDPEKLDNLFVLDIPTAGTAEVLLSRDEMGVPFIEESHVSQTEDWLTSINDARETLAQLLDSSARLEIATRRAQSALFILARTIENT